MIERLALGARSALSFAIPLEPDVPDARDLLVEELSNPAYAASQPTWFDVLSQAVLEWLGNLGFGTGDGVPALALILGGALIAVAVLAAILVYGLPRWRRRSRVDHDLFGEQDRRTARDLRRDSERAAAAEDWAVAIADRFRAIARALDERTVVIALPGTTGHGFADATGSLYPEHRDQLQLAADYFDAVRYLGEPGDPSRYAHVRELDTTIASKPAALPRVSELTSGDESRR